ncbi:MAG: hypothetical protein K6G22_14040 [Lachnospiraceae bacterium]|nr:hypothetical protein [Lachnospiraceae bacterium]
MTDTAVIIAGVLFNFIVYLAFGSLILYKKSGDPSDAPKVSLPIRLLAGFFFYYTVFFVFCVPVMKMYRPLSMLSGIWGVFTLVVIAVSAILNHKLWFDDLKELLLKIRTERFLFVFLLLFVGLQIFLTAFTYNFTLDASFYVAGVSTNIDTNMINVYDPFTGAWQDHFEMRYFFATYPVQDAVVCQIFKISPLIWTKSVMAVTIILLTNCAYYLIVNALNAGRQEKAEDKKAYRISVALTLTMILFVNLTFNTIYSASVFLFTRTYEGKAIVGNLAVLFIFYMFILLNDEKAPPRAWLILFFICFGASTVSSTANMLLPVEMTVLFLPMIIRKKQYKRLLSYMLCVIPGVVFALLFVLYVKGKFVFYTYPR